MKTVVLNFTQPSSKEVILLLAPDDMDVQAEIAECRTRCHRSSFSREYRSATVYNWLCDRGCRGYGDDIVMIDGWHEPPMTRPRSENCNVPLVEPYIRIGETYPDPIDADWVEEASRQIGVQYRSLSELAQEECVARSIRRPVRTETVPNNIYQTMLPGRTIEWRPFARNMEIAVEPGDPLHESSGSDAPQLTRFLDPMAYTWSDGSVDLDEMRELARRAAGISESRASSLSQPPTTRDQDQR